MFAQIVSSGVEESLADAGICFGEGSIPLGGFACVSTGYEPRSAPCISLGFLPWGETCFRGQIPI
jgi:hypothetical protein